MQVYDIWTVEHFPFIAEHFGDCKSVKALQDTCHKVDPYIDVDSILLEIAGIGVDLYGNDPSTGMDGEKGFQALLQYGFEIAYYEINMDDLNADESNHVTG